MNPIKTPTQIFFRVCALIECAIGTYFFSLKQNYDGRNTLKHQLLIELSPADDAETLQFVMTHSVVGLVLDFS